MPKQRHNGMREHGYRLAGIVTVALSALTLTQGCANIKECTAVGWNEGLTVTVASAEPLTEGTYRVTIDVPGESFELVLNVNASGAYKYDDVRRNDWQVSGWLQTFDGTATGELVIGRYNGLSGGPESVSITVEQDGANVGVLDLPTVSYGVAELNGPGCGEATMAGAELSLSPVQ